MLGVNSYSKDYVASVRRNIADLLKKYHASSNEKYGELEPVLFNHMLLALDSYFVHRLRGQEKKDGNPLNEVRMLVATIQSHGGKLAADSTIKYSPEKSVLKYQIGDDIQMTADDFEKLATEFLAEVESKFP
jgi:hypothetical protein